VRADGRTYQEALSNVEVVMQSGLKTAHDSGSARAEAQGRLLYA